MKTCDHTPLTVRLMFGSLLVILLASQPLYAADHTKKKLLEFGWDEPDTSFLRAHIAEMQNSPFTGCVFHADYQKADGSKGSFTWQCWGTNAFTEADLLRPFMDLRNIRFGGFNCNFPRFNTTPGRLDWFDDHAAIMQNATLAAKLARTGHCPGILFDIEQYDGPLFEYHKQRDAATKSWELYAAQVRQRGAEVMQAFQKGYPDLTVFLTFGYSLPWHQTERGKKPLADCRYGLLAPFLDGLVASAHGRTRIVDGYELSYGYKTAAQFSAARREVTEDLLPIVSNPGKYRQVFSLAFGLWLDHDWRKAGWNVEEPEKNYFSPAQLESTTREALRMADEYVWIYSETPRWWSTDSKPVKLPEQYAAALKNALRLH
ncbi:MAG TPA: hypothetical protein VL361_21565 [Candidatus Limnocylindrales bacterium]|nr:hypothetical protein [Candidatus Limnocylindrales bacterium]